MYKRQVHICSIHNVLYCQQSCSEDFAILKSQQRNNTGEIVYAFRIPIFYIKGTFRDYPKEMLVQVKTRIEIQNCFAKTEDVFLFENLELNYTDVF